MVKKGIAIFFLFCFCFSMLLPSQGRSEARQMMRGEGGILKPLIVVDGYLRIGGDPYWLNRPVKRGEKVMKLKEDLLCTNEGATAFWRGTLKKGEEVVVRKTDNTIVWIRYCGNPMGERIRLIIESPPRVIVEKKVFVDRPVVKKVFIDRPVEKKVFVKEKIFVDRPVEKKVFVDRPVVKKVFIDRPVEKKVFVKKKIFIDRLVVSAPTWLIGVGTNFSDWSLGLSIGTNHGGAGGALAAAMCGGDQGPFSLSLGAGMTQYLGRGVHLGVGGGPYLILGGEPESSESENFGFGGGLVFSWGGNTTPVEKTSFGPGIGIAWHPGYKKPSDPSPPGPDPDPHPEEPPLGDPEPDLHPDPPALSSAL
ncbi:hypothetical protein KKF09_00310 [Patescibacteria group bacterium]|nr:hypothetical protein [Patescibacteria group bacterium]